MDIEVIIALVQNIAILVALVFIYSLLLNNKMTGKIYYKFALGLFNGLIGILLMWTALRLDNGVIFDTRSILISVSGMFFGVIPTAIAGIIMIIYRVFIGGSGMLMGILVVITTSLIGMAGHKFSFKKIMKTSKHRGIKFYVFGLIVHADMLLCMLALPRELQHETWDSIFWPVMILYPLGTYLLCKILLDQMHQHALVVKIAESEEKYRRIADNTSDMIWTTDANLKLTYVSPSSEKIFGETPKEYIAQPFDKRFAPEDKEACLSFLQDIISKRQGGDKISKGSPILECRHLTKDGLPIWISMSANGIWDEKGQLIGITGIIRDINSLKKIEIENNRQHALTAAIIDAIPDIIFYKDVNGIYQGGNKAFAKSCGRPKREIFGKTDFDLFPLEAAESFQNYDRLVMTKRRQKHNEEVFFYADGTKGYLDTLKTPFWALDGSVAGIIGISRDITERKEKENEIQHIAFHDYLTGLYNRRYYEEELNRLNVSRNLPLSIVMGDVNGLKLVNDSFGHGYGDLLLQKVAQIMKGHCRTDDIIARFGGDEFVLLLPNTSAKETEIILNRIHDSLGRESVNGINLSVSFGYQTKVEESEDIESISKRAEDMMYRNKLLVSSSVRSKTIDIIMNTLYEKNNREMLHSKRVSDICEKFAAFMGLSSGSIEQVTVAGLMHDIGKIGIDEKILNSPNKLTDEEWVEMKKHSEIGYRILSASEEFAETACFVLEHQEKWDGTGYPQGISGETISLEARIIAIADAFDAMTRARTYGTVFTPQQALVEISNCAGSHFDPQLAMEFVTNYEKIFGW